MNILMLLKRPWFNKDRFETIAAFMIAYLGLLLAITVYQTDRTDNIAERLTGQVIQQTMQATSTLAVGQFTADYGWTQAYRLWLEIDALSLLSDDETMAAQYGAVRDKVRELSPLLQPPYFEDEEYLPLIEAFESDIYLVDLTLEQEHLALTMAQAGAWGDIKDDYELLSRILTAGLLLTGLMVTLSERSGVQRFAFGVVVLMSLYATVNLGLITQRTIPDRPEAAMQRLADGVGLYHEHNYEAAIEAFTDALELDPTYTEAHVQRGFAYRDSFDDEEVNGQIAAATADFEAAVTDGRTEVDVIGQLAELYYLQGLFKDAQRVSQVGVDETDVFMHTFDLARSQLADGDIAAAEDTYAQGLAEAVTEYNAATPDQPLSSAFWRALDIGALELDALALCAEQELCDGAPPYLTLSQPAETAAAAKTFGAQLKTLSMSLELTGTAFALTDAEPITVSDLRFSAEADVMDTETIFIDGVREIEASFDYQDVSPDATIVIKVFVDDWEYPPLRQATTLENAPDGTYTFTLRPGVELGSYTVHVYIDGRWVQQGRFEIIPVEEE